MNLPKTISANQPAAAGSDEPADGLPLSRFLTRCHAEIAADVSGAVADYIPELSKANPAHFGISFATIDGHVYAVGDSEIPFTIQSISKAFVFALALQSFGAERIQQVIGVEPSGDAFNAIRLLPDNRPFNPMVNAGAIACSGLICEAEGDAAFERILDTLGRFAGRRLAVDEAVFASESATGDRNRAIAWLLRNHGVLKGDVDSVLEVYFRQCSTLVTARDLAVMAATLANRGVNPLTGEQVIAPYVIARTLSVMTSSGMYDYAGEWIYRVGIPAKSGVGGGIMAAIPSQLGLGTYSPLLDDHGNSIRGLKTCEALSSHFELHVLNRSGDVRACVVADYGIDGIASRRGRQPLEQQILDERQRHNRVLELAGALTFETAEYLSRLLAATGPQCRYVILDFRRVPSLTKAAAELLVQSLESLTAGGVTAILCGIEQRPASISPAIEPWLERLPKLRRFASLDAAIEWVEDQIVYRYGGFERLERIVALDRQPLLAGLAAKDIESLSKHMRARSFEAGERVVTAGEPASSIFFLQSGMVSVKLPGGIRVATISAGMTAGEMALLDQPRSADVWADTAVQCLELPISAYRKLRDRHPQIGERIALNLSALLAKRLIAANTKIELLTSH